MTHFTNRHGEPDASSPTPARLSPTFHTVWNVKETDGPARNGDILGYARVSTAAQDAASQQDRLREAGAIRVFVDVILDVYEEPDDEIPTDSGTYDETYWRERSKEALEAAQYLFELTSSVYTDPELRHNKIAIVIRSRMHAGYNQLSIRKGAGKNVLLRFRYGAKRDEMQELLESNGISFQERRSAFRFQMTTEMVKSKREMLEQIARLNKEWWTH